MSNSTHWPTFTMVRLWTTPAANRTDRNEAEEPYYGGEATQATLVRHHLTVDRQPDRPGQRYDGAAVREHRDDCQSRPARGTEGRTAPAEPTSASSESGAPPPGRGASRRPPPASPVAAIRYGLASHRPDGAGGRVSCGRSRSSASGRRGRPALRPYLGRARAPGPRSAP